MPKRPKRGVCSMPGCKGNIGWDKDEPLSYFRVPAIISEKNKRFCGYGQEERHKRVIELSRERRKAWLKVIRREDAPDELTIKVCARHFITGRPADLEDDENPDWVPYLNLGDAESRYGKKRNQAAMRRHLRYKLKQKRAEAVKIYGGSSDPPVIVETDDYDDIFTPETELRIGDDAIVDGNAVVNLEPGPSTSANNDNNANDDIPIEAPTDDADMTDEALADADNTFVETPADEANIPVDILADTASSSTTHPKESYGHWHVHFCTKKACLFSKVVAKTNTIESLNEDD